MSKRKTVAILEGWAGGAWHTKHFVKALEEAGFSIDNVNNAHAIIAHSTGCYRIPKSAKPQIVILMGPPYWPGKSIIRRLVKKKKYDNSLVLKMFGRTYPFKKSLWELVYIFAKPAYTLVALRNHKKIDFLEHIRTERITLIRNTNDYFCSPDIKNDLAQYKNRKIKYLELPGEHDDYYVNPDPYIKLLLKEYELAKAS